MADDTDKPNPLEEPPAAERHPVVFGTTVVVLLVLSLAGGLQGRTDEPLPSVAMNSGLLLVAERSAALFAVLFLVALVVIRAVQGELPQELSGRGVKYASSDAVDQLRSQVRSTLGHTDARIQRLEDNQDVFNEGDVASPERAGAERADEPAERELPRAVEAGDKSSPSG